MMKFKHGAIALVLLCGSAALACAAEVTTVTTTDTTVQKSRTEWAKHDQPVYKPGAHLLDLSALDANGDGILTKAEVGRALFKVFDTDGNDLIDNVEFDKKIITTIVPMKETETVSYYSGDNDVPDKTVVSTTDFMKSTQLSRFDKGNDGLSARDFMGEQFFEADVNHDHFVDIKEWQGAYNAAINAQNLKDQQYSLNK